jgi:hypothetical protein
VIGAGENLRIVRVGPRSERGDTIAWTLVLHWNGTSWSRQPIPNLDFAASATNELRGVTVASPTSVWAAGDYGSSPSKAFVIHCC